jgi:hypothetical protein
MKMRLLRAACTALVLVTATCSRDSWPAGANVTPSHGGEVKLDSAGTVVVTIPPGAVPTPAAITLAAPAVSDTPATLAPETAFELRSTVSLAAAVDVRAVVRDTSRLNAKGVQCSELGLYHFASRPGIRRPWQKVQSQADCSSFPTVVTATGVVQELGTYGVLGAPVDTVVVSP